MEPKGGGDGHGQVVATMKFNVTQNIVFTIMVSLPALIGAQLSFANVEKQRTMPVENKVQTTLMTIVQGIQPIRLSPK